MSLYAMQKLIFELNRDPAVQQRYRADKGALLGGYDLDIEERDAIAREDIGLIYVMGVNGQLLMHFAAFAGLDWPSYIQAMRDGVAKHGPVRAGVYAMTTRLDEKVADL